MTSTTTFRLVGIDRQRGADLLRRLDTTLNAFSDESSTCHRALTDHDPRPTHAPLRHRGIAAAPSVVTQPASADGATARPPSTSAATALGAAASVGAAFGVATAYGQYWLPEEIGSLANSSGSWCAVAFVLALLAPRPGSAALSGAVALIGLLAGYVLGAASRGDPSSSSLLLFWGLAALVVGPVLGVAAWHVRHGTAIRAAAGIGVLSGILIGEGAYGLSVVAETTHPPFWWAQIGVGAAVLAVAAVRSRQPAAVALSLLTTGVVAAAFVALYSLDLIAWLS